jgi:ankyrin repeat protein
MTLNDIPLLDFLVSRGATLSDAQGRAPWHDGYATHELADYLLDRHAPLPAGEGAARLITNLARDNHLHTLRRLLDAGASPNEKFDSGFTPLMFVARDGPPEAVQLLIAHHADPNARNTNNQTALDLAKDPRTRALLRPLTQK